MTRSCIVTADDFGLTKSINDGIAQAFTEGVVTSVNLIPTGAAFDDAVATAAALKLGEVGAHLALTETTPLTDPKEIRSLTAADGSFPRGYAELFVKRMAGQVDDGLVYRELKKQLERIKATGIPITNLTGHEHIHMAPGILDIFIRLAEEYHIPAIRYPCEAWKGWRFTPKRIAKYCIRSFCCPRLKRALAAARLAHADHFFGFFDSGRLTEDILVKAIPFLREGTTEIVAHPGYMSPEVFERYGWHRNCETELFALTSRRVKQAFADNMITLTSYGKLSAADR